MFKPHPSQKIGLDNLFSIINRSGKRGVMAVLSQMASEASEEALSEVANNLVDIAFQLSCCGVELDRIY